MIKVNTTLHTGGVPIASGAVVTCNFVSRRSESDGAGNVARYSIEFGLFVNRTHQQWKDDSSVLVGKIDEFSSNIKLDIDKTTHQSLTPPIALGLLEAELEGILGADTCEIIDPES